MLGVDGEYGWSEPAARPVLEGMRRVNSIVKAKPMTPRMFSRYTW